MGSTLMRVGAALALALALAAFFGRDALPFIRSSLGRAWTLYPPGALERMMTHGFAALLLLALAAGLLLFSRPGVKR